MLEIGPGKGILTGRLVAIGAHVSAIELDRGLLAQLRASPALDDVQWLEGDAAKLDWPYHDVLVSNLPYQISGPVLGRLVDPLAFDPPERAVLMIQKEVADRLLARPGSKQYGRLAVKAAYQWKTTRLTNVKPGAFSPPPKVTSSVVLLEQTEPRFELRQPTLFNDLVDLLFQHRRKQVRSTLRLVHQSLGIRKELIERYANDAQDLGQAWPTARPEQLQAAIFAALADSLSILQRRG